MARVKNRRGVVEANEELPGRAERRAAFERVSQADWEECVDALTGRAKRGDLEAYRLLAPWMVGRSTDEMGTAETGVVIYLPEREIKP